MIKAYLGLIVKDPIIMPNSNHIWVFSTDFIKVLKMAVTESLDMKTNFQPSQKQVTLKP